MQAFSIGLPVEVEGIPGHTFIVTRMGIQEIEVTLAGQLIYQTGQLRVTMTGGQIARLHPVFPKPELCEDDRKVLGW